MTNFTNNCFQKNSLDEMVKQEVQRQMDQLNPVPFSCPNPVSCKCCEHWQEEMYRCGGRGGGRGGRGGERGGGRGGRGAERGGINVFRGFGNRARGYSDRRPYSRYEYGGYDG